MWDEYLITNEDYWFVNSEYYPIADEVVKAINRIETGWPISTEERTTPKFEPYYQDVLPAYCDAFKSYLGYRLSTCKPVEVGLILDNKFIKPDQIDCDYLTDILAEIGIDIEKGYGYDPGKLDGLDSYLSVEPNIHPNLKSAYRWIERTREVIAKAARHNTENTRREPVEMTLPTSPQNLPRPASTFERQKLADTYYYDMRGHFKSKDYTDWREIKMPDGKAVAINYEDVILPYCRLYPKMLGYVFSCIDSMDVPNVLDKHFRKPDLIDIDYINDVFNDIQGVLDSNYSFSTTAQDGIDYYNGFKNESEMFHLSFENVDTSNKNLVRFVTPNLERAKKWLTRTEELIRLNLTSTKPEPISTTTTNTGSPDKQKSSAAYAPVETNTIAWQGSIADLAEVFYRLARAGMIDLATPRGPEGNMLGVCRQICQLFQVPPKAQDGAVKNLYAYINKFSAEQLAPGPIDEAALPKAIGRKYTNRNTQHLNTTLGNLSPTNEDE